MAYGRPKPPYFLRVEVNRVHQVCFEQFSNCARWNAETKLLKGSSELLSDLSLLNERMQVNGFDTLIKAIRTISGDEKCQLEMVKEKLQVHIKEATRWLTSCNNWTRRYKQ